MAAKQIAIVTSSKNPRLSDSSMRLVRALERKGYTVTSFPWDRRNKQEPYAALLPLECWNYHLHRQEFLGWLEERKNEGIRILNPVPIIRWNTDKTYLLELEKSGIPIIPTAIIRPEGQDTPGTIMEKRHWQHAIIKPTVGASAYGTKKISLQSAHLTKEIIDRSAPWIIQEYFEGISKGEYSFVFFNREFSHAVLKVPKANEYRVHIDYGGTEIPVQPDQHLISQAASVLNVVEGPLLYARVDAVETNGRLLLMELELTEPYLFFDSDPASADRFVRAYELL